MFSSLARSAIICLLALLPGMAPAQDMRALAQWHLNWTPGARGQALAVLDALDRNVPLQWSITGALAPSSNMAGVTHHRTLALPGGGTGQILSAAPRAGWRGSANIALSWQQVVGPGRRLIAAMEVGVDGHEGDWTPTAQFSVTHRVMVPRRTRWLQMAVETQGTNARHLRMAVGWDMLPNPQERISLGVQFGWSHDAAQPYLDGVLIAANLRRQWEHGRNLSLELGGEVSIKQSQLAHNGYVGAGLDMRAAWQFRPDIALDGGVAVMQRSHRAITPGLGAARHDVDLALDVGVRDRRLRVFGQTPRFGCRYAQTKSTIALYDRRETRCGVTFRYAF